MGIVTGAIVDFEVDGKTYEGEVKFLSDGTCEAISNFKPASRSRVNIPAALDVEQQLRQELERIGPAEGHVYTASQTLTAVGEEAAIIPIRRSRACFWAEKSGSKEILDPVWLDIGVVSVATAYHPKCGKVTFLIDPCAANGTDEAGYNVTTFTRGWEFDPSSVTRAMAKAIVGENWSKFCKQHEKPIPAAPEWLQIKDCIWVCEHNGWIALLNPAWAAPGLYLSRAWKASDITEHAGPTPLLTLDEAKAKILSLMI